MRSVIFAVLLSLFALQARAQDVIHTKDGRTLKGTVVSEDDKVVKLKMKFGTMTIKRSDIDRIEKAGGKKRTPKGTGSGAGSGTKGPVKGMETHRSPFLGYQITKPDRYWVFKKAAPAPLVDLMVYHSRLDAEVRVGINYVGKMAIEEKNLAGYAAGTKRGMMQINTAVKLTVHEMKTYGGTQAFHLRYEGTSKFTQKHKIYDELLFDAKGRRYQILCEVPAENEEKAKPGFEAILESFAFIKAKERDGQRFYNFDLLYELDVPTGGELARVGPAKVTVTAKGAEFSVTVTPQVDLIAARELGKAHEAKLEDKAGFKLRSNLTANLLGSLAAEVKYYTEKHEHIDLIVLQNRKRYLIERRWPKGTGGLATLKPVLNSFTIQPDLTSESSIAEGRKARDHAHKGTMADLTNNPAVAAAQYEAALELFPRYALAHNNLSIIYSRANKTDKAFYHSQKAYKLYSENALYKHNQGIALTNKAYGLLREKQYKKAITALERARRVNPKDKQLIARLAQAHYYVGVGKMNAKQYSAAMGSMRKAMRLAPKEPTYKAGLANCYYYTAIAAWNNRQYKQCLVPLNKCLKILPTHQGAAKMKIEVMNALKRK